MLTRSITEILKHLSDKGVALSFSEIEKRLERSGLGYSIPDVMEELVDDRRFETFTDTNGDRYIRRSSQSGFPEHRREDGF